MAGDLGPSHPHALFSLHSLLSITVLPAPHRDATSAYWDVIDRRYRLVGEDHTVTLTSVSTFVQRLVELGRADDALPLARTILERRSAADGPEQSATSTARVRLIQPLGALSPLPEEEVEHLVASIDAFAEAALMAQGPGRQTHRRRAARRIRGPGRPRTA